MIYNTRNWSNDTTESKKKKKKRPVLMLILEKSETCPMYIKQTNKM